MSITQVTRHCYTFVSEFETWNMPNPKAVIFDLGGVLITSPLKSIEEYEALNNIPAGYLNYAMSSWPE
jgi:hypothetical protein